MKNIISLLVAIITCQLLVGCVTEVEKPRYKSRKFIVDAKVMTKDQQKKRDRSSSSTMMEDEKSWRKLR